LGDVAGSLTWFAGGVAVGALAAGAAYATNYSIAVLLSRAREWDQPFIRDGQRSNRWRWIARSFHILTIALGIGSVAAFGLGIVPVRKSIGRLDPTMPQSVAPMPVPRVTAPPTPSK
jgi:hypothetical protein